MSFNPNKEVKKLFINISTYDVYESNGVIHVIDKVVLPKYGFLI